MRILYINKTFSGPMEALSRFVAQKQGVSAVFMAERWSRDKHVPGMMRVRIPVVSLPDVPHEGRDAEHAAETLLSRNACNADNVKNLCLHLQKSGFVPDVVYATTQDGYAQDVGDVFPKARRVAQMGWFYPQPAPAKGIGSDGMARPVPLPAFARLHNAAQIVTLSESALGITSSHWQKSFVAGMEEKLHLVAHGVDTHFFEPDTMRDTIPECVTFACQQGTAAHDIHNIYQCLPDILALRAQCRVRLVSFASRTAQEQYAADLTALLPPLNESERQRVEIIVSPTLGDYVQLLQGSTVYVCLTPPGLLSMGLLEAMSCGRLVLASDTEPVREIITHGENGLLWPHGESPQSLAAELARILESAPDAQHLQTYARETILARHNIRALLPRHADLVLG